MGKNRSVELTLQKPMKLALLFSCIITLYFNPQLQDPFNAPKQWILLASSAWLLGYLILDRKYLSGNRIIDLAKWLLFLFTAALFVSAVKTNVHYVAFIGETQRKLGFLTYLSLVIFMLTVIVYTNTTSIYKLYYYGFFTGLVLGIYSLMQSTGNDFVQWNNPYNKILGTLGNPNFASACMAILATLSFSSILISSFNKYFRFASLMLCTLLLYNINSSDSRQGLVSFLFGIGAVIVGILYRRKKLLGYLGLGAFLVTGFLSVMGMLQIGPLTSLLYKGSVTVRGYYWNAGYEMFKNNLFFGVGTDRYGAYFKEYRKVDYPLTYGFDITASNAHNIFIQFFATSGIFVGILFIAINILVFLSGLKILRYAEKENLSIYIGIFGAWLAFVAQSVISIDNIGLTIWGWLFGGIIIAISSKIKVTSDEGDLRANSLSANNVTDRTKQSVQIILSAPLTFFAVILISFLYRGEILPMQSYTYYNSTNPPNSSPKHFELANKIFNSQLIDPFYKLKAAERVAMAGNKEEGLRIMKVLHAYDPNNLDYLLSLAALAQNMENYELAIDTREKITKHDPWNAKNYLDLGLVYKFLGNFEKMNDCRQIIMSFAKDTQEGKLAVTELVK